MLKPVLRAMRRRCWPFRHRWLPTGGLYWHASPGIQERLQYWCERCGKIK